MQDDPPLPANDQGTSEPHEQAKLSQQLPEEAKAPEDANPPLPKERVQSQLPQDEGDTELNSVGLSDAQRLFASDGSSPREGVVTEPKAPFKQQFERAKARRRKSAGREPYLEMDHFTPYEIGMATLRERLPYQHPALADIEILCQRLHENIHFVRINGETPEKQADRQTIVRELNNQSLIVIHIAFYDLCQIADLDNARGETNTGLPQTQSQVANWYTSLTWFERCYVIAVCVLQGAPSHEVSRAANELHELIEQAYPPWQPVAADERPISNGKVGPAFISAEEMLAHTYALTRKLYGAERILWRDDAFDPLVREFLARQATTVGMRFADRNLLDILEEWAISGNEERSLRAGRVLAGMWWRQHQDKVLDLAETWARSDDENVWQGGAALLYGAYAAERAERPEINATDSDVLRRLRGWADWRDDAEMAQVAAFTYGLIGRQWPEVALDGLDHLLCLGASARTTNNTPPLPVIFLAMLSYVEVATSGQIRPLLNRFASHAAHYTRGSRHTNRGVFEDEQSYMARERGLDMLFFHIVFLVALSLDGVRQGKGHTSYMTKVRLPPLPDMPSSRGQDVLLAGVLAEPEREWRANVCTLFCAAIFARRGQFVFDVLVSWIRIVAYEPHGDATQSLLRFVADMYTQLRAWDVEHHRSGLGAGSNLLEQRLLFWTKATREYVLRPFAQRALEVLHK